MDMKIRQILVHSEKNTKLKPFSNIKGNKRRIINNPPLHKK